MTRITSSVVRPVAFLVMLAIQFSFWQPDLTAQDYRSSITATEFDFIVESDPSTFVGIEFKSKGLQELPDKRSGDQALRQEAFLFVASFSDNTKVKIVIDADFKTQEAALAESNRYVHRLGKIPTALRKGVERLVVHQGGRDTTAFSDVGLIVLYSENATKRISTHDLEETIFHESVHAAWDKTHANSTRWNLAQAADKTFVTMYAQSKPSREDLAESAIFAYTLLHHPDRIPEPDATKIKKAIPNRILYISYLLPPEKPIFFDVEPADAKAEVELEPAAARAELEAAADDPNQRGCNIHVPAVFSDILSNALLLQFEIDEKKVREFTANAGERFDTSEELFQLAITEFKIEEQDLKDAVVKFLHCNCSHPDIDDSAAKQLVESWKSKR